MQNRVICPACGKSNRLSDEGIGGAIVCLACGYRIVVEADAPEVTDADVTDVPVVAGQADFVRSAATRPRRMPARSSSVGKIVGVGIVCLLVGAIAAGMLTWFSNKSRNEQTNDLLELKSEAEALAIEGKLDEAHAKYRELQKRAAGRVIKDGLLWDVMERAQVDQDRIYTLLLDRAQAANPPEQAMPKPGTGTTTRADDPWYWPRVGNGGRAGVDATAAPTSTGPSEDATGNADATPSEPAATQEILSQTDPAAAQPIEIVPRTRTPARWVPDDAVTDEEIGVAIERGANYLLKQFKGDEINLPEMTRTMYSGRNALAVYALIQAGRATNNPELNPRGQFMSRLIDRMKLHSMERGGNEPAQPIVYARSLRAAALALANRPQDRALLKADSDWLVKAAVQGAYSYDDTFSKMANQEMGDAELMQWDSADKGSEEFAWNAAWRMFCDGLHDRNGRELNRMKANPSRVKKVKAKPYGSKPTGTPPPRTGVPQKTAVPGSVPMPPQPPRMPLRRTTPNGGEEEMMFPWDNSNSQYGLLGVWAAAETGIEVPRTYWESVQSHWETWQLRNGQWGYAAPDQEGTHAMTCGGVASLWVTYDWLVAPKSSDAVGRSPMSKSLEKGMKWLETSDNAINTPILGKTHYFGYDLFSIERVGLASGFKYFGANDWYRTLAAKSVKTQFPSGAWGRDDGNPDALIETAYQILFLAHGRHPIFMNKLRFEKGQGEQLDGKPLPGYWTNRPRDVANLTRFAARELERPLNWQVVDLNRDWHDWLDCPVLYIASHSPPGMTDADYAKLRQFAEAGGLIFTHADGGDPDFTRWVVEELSPKVFPNRKAEPLPQDHPIYSFHYDLKKARLPLWQVSNGSRLLLVHSPSDLSTAWQKRSDRTQTPLFQLGMHLFLYAAGKADFRNRIDSPYVPPAPQGEEGTVGVARVKYDGDWDPEPGAWRRFANLYQWEMDVNVPVTAVEFSALDPRKTPVAHLTGNGAVKFSDADAAAVRNYVEAGGKLLVDPCGGSKEFNTSVRDDLLAKAFSKTPPKAVPPTHPLIASADPETEPLTLRLRSWAADQLKMKAPTLEMIEAGEGVVILSQVDITTGLLGTNTITTIGYDSPIAQAICWRLLEWAGSSMPAANAP
jgi:hypothetical protein